MRDVTYSLNDLRIIDFIFLLSRILNIFLVVLLLLYLRFMNAQVEVDSQLLEVIGKNPDAEVLKQYLKKPFALNSRMYPHALKF